MLMKIDIAKISKLAGLTLTDSEIKKFSKQLAEVINYVDKLSEISFKNSTAENSYHNLKNSSRGDRLDPSLNQEEALSNHKKSTNGYFTTKRIL